MIIGVSFCQEDDLQIKQPKFLADQKIFHHPPKVLFNSRAFDLEVFTEYDKKQVKQVSLFFRTDSQPRYREVTFSKVLTATLSGMIPWLILLIILPIFLQLN